MRTDVGKRRWSIRAVGLFISSFVCVTRGVLYLPPVATSSSEPLPLGIESLTTLLPRHIWAWEWQPVWLFGAMWLAVGIAGMVDVFRARRGSVLYLFMVGLLTFWAIGYAGSTVFLGSRSGWASGIVFGVIAGYTELFRRMRPSVAVTSASVEARLRIAPATERVFFLQDGEWVEIHPEVIR